MTDDTTKFNVITFDADDKSIVFSASSRIFLKADGELTWNVGLEAAVWSFLCPYTEFEKLGSKPGRSGSLKFWFNRKPEPTLGQTPDLEMKGWTIIDATANVYGERIHQSGLKIIEYRVFVADFRYRFKPPFGGLLVDGALNAQPIVNNTDAHGLAVLSNSQLLQLCIDKLGVPIKILAKVDGLPAIKDLKWENSPAVAELEKLLTTLGCIFVPELNGTGSIQGIGEGAAPTIAKEQNAGTLPLPNFDRRGDVVVFVGPPILETVSVDGSKLVFVIINSDGKWTDVADATLITPPGPTSTLNHNFENVSTQFREQVRTQLYHCVRLTTHEPMFRNIPFPDDVPKQISVQARIAVQANDGTWGDTFERIACTPLALLDDGKVLVVKERLIQCGFNFGQLDPRSYREPGDGDIKITFTRQATDPLTVKLKPFRIAYRQDVGNLTSISDDKGIDAAIQAGARQIPRDDFQLYRNDGGDQNRSLLEAAAASLAPKYLRDDKNVASLQVAIGFVQSGLSGRVNEIKITQSPPKMEFKVNTAYSPLAGILPFASRAELAG
jgi:hypothetical protein